MKIIFRQCIFSHRWLYPWDMTSCEELLLLSGTQPRRERLTALDRPRSLRRVTSLVTGHSGPKLIHQQEETVSATSGVTFPSPPQ